MIVPSPPSTPHNHQHQNARRVTITADDGNTGSETSKHVAANDDSSASSSTSSHHDENDESSSTKKMPKKPLDRKSSSFALVAQKKIKKKQNNNNHGVNDDDDEDEIERDAAALKNSNINTNEDETAAIDDGLDEEEQLEKQIERENIARYAEFIRRKLAPALVCWRSQFAEATDDLLSRLSAPQSKLWDRKVIQHHHHTKTKNHKATGNIVNPLFGRPKVKTTTVNTSAFAADSSQLDGSKTRNLQDNRNCLDFQIYLSSLQHTSSHSGLPLRTLIAPSAEVTKQRKTDTNNNNTSSSLPPPEALPARPKTDDDFLAYEPPALMNELNHNNNQNSNNRSSISSSSRYECDPHVIVSAGSLFAFEQHLCSLFDPPYDSLCRRAIQELQTAIYFDGQKAVDRSSMSDVMGSFVAGKSRSDLLSSKYVHLTWCQMFTFLLAKVKTAKAMIGFKQSTLNGQLALLDRTVDRWRRATSIRLLREWYDFTRKQVHLRKKFREAFVALSHTATTRRAITRWKAVCRMARDRVEAESDLQRQKNNNNKNNTSNSNLSTPATNSLAASTNNATFGGSSANNNSDNNKSSHAEGMAHATVRALQGQLVVRGSMLDHLSNVVKQLRKKAAGQQENVDATLKKQSRILHQFRSLKNALFPAPVFTEKEIQNHQQRLNSNNNTNPYRALTSEEWETQMRTEMEQRVFQDRKQRNGGEDNNNSNSGTTTTTSNPLSNLNNPAFGEVVAMDDLEDSVADNKNNATTTNNNDKTISFATTTVFGSQNNIAPAAGSSSSSRLSPDHYSPSYHHQNNNNSPSSSNNNSTATIRWPEVLASSPQTCTRASHVLVRVRHLISILCVFISALQKDVVKITGTNDSNSTNNNNTSTISPRSRSRSVVSSSPVGGPRLQRKQSNMFSDHDGNESSLSLSTTYTQNTLTSKRSHTNNTSSSHQGGLRAAGSFRAPARFVANSMGKDSGEVNTNYSGDPHSIVATFLQELDLDHNEEKVNDEMGFVRALLSAINRVAFAGLYQYPNVLSFLPSRQQQGSSFYDNNNSSNQQNNNGELERNVSVMNAMMMHVSTSGTFNTTSPDDMNHYHQNDNNNNSSSSDGVMQQMFPLFLPTSSFAKTIEFDNPAWVAMLKVSLHALFGLTPMSIPKLMLLSMIEGNSSSSNNSGMVSSSSPTNSGKKLSSPTTATAKNANSSSSSSPTDLLTGGALTSEHRAKSMKNLKQFRKKALLNSNQQQQQQEEADQEDIMESSMRMMSRPTRILSTSQEEDSQEEDPLEVSENSGEQQQQQQQHKTTKQRQDEENSLGISVNYINKLKQKPLPPPPMPPISELRKEWEHAENLCRKDHHWLMDTCERNYSEKAREIISHAFDQGETSQLVSQLYDKLLRSNPRLRHNIPVEVLAQKLRIVFGEDNFLQQQNIHHHNSNNSKNNNRSHHHHHQNDDHDDDNDDDNNEVTSPRALEELRQSYHAAATSNNNNNNYNNYTSSSPNPGSPSSAALAPSGSLSIGPVGSSAILGGDGKMRYPSSLSSTSALKGQWKAVLQNRQRHFVNDAKDLEFVLHSISKVMLLELPALIEKIEATFDDTDLFFVAMSSQELHTILLEHETEFGHLFLLNATKRREAGGKNVSGSQQSLLSAGGSNNNNMMMNSAPSSTPPSLLLMTREDFSAFCKPWCDAFLSMGVVHEIFLKTVQRYDHDARSVTNLNQQSHLHMSHELFPYAVAMVAATKNPSPFIPLRVKLQYFIEKQVVPMASSCMLGAYNVV